MIEDIVLEMLVTGVIQEESSMDRIASAGFEGIAQMLLEQKKLMDALEAENRELRRQLNDLRRGIGIAVVIEGKTIQLATDQSVSQAQAALQSLQNLQNQGTQAALQSTPSSQPAISGGYAQNTRQTGGQQTANLGGDKRDNGSSRGPLADSFLLT
jgi:YesN/AraC family two-component response regulator